jgi:hypothetical protein
MSLAYISQINNALIFMSSITKGQPSIYFDRSKVFNYEMIQGFCDGLDCVEEMFLSRRLKRFCS